MEQEGPEMGAGEPRGKPRCQLGERGHVIQGRFDCALRCQETDEAFAPGLQNSISLAEPESFGNLDSASTSSRSGSEENWP